MCLTRRMLAGLSLALIVACLTGSGAVWAQIEDLPKAETVLAKYIEATGGKAAYDKVNNRVVKGTIEPVGSGITLTMTVYAAKPNKTYAIIESDVTGKIERGTTGDAAWENSLMNGPVIKSGQEKADMLRDARLDRMAYWQDVYKQAECTGIEDVDGKPCYKVVLTPKEGKPQTYFFDKDAGLLVKMESTVENPMGTIPVEAYIGDYKKVDGLLMPHKVRQSAAGQEMVITTESIEQNLDLPADRFDPPAEVKELLDKQKSEGGKTGD
jgi:outer membrane lipoprotein-sorting protein